MVLIKIDTSNNIIEKIQEIRNYYFGQNVEILRIKAAQKQFWEMPWIHMIILIWYVL